MHRFIPPTEGVASPLDPSHTLAIKRWVRELLGLPETSVITVSEVACLDAACPLVESTVAIWDAKRATRTFTFTRPKIAVTKLMVHQTLEASGALELGALERRT